jgi:hypothetical protein
MFSNLNLNKLGYMYRFILIITIAFASNLNCVAQTFFEVDSIHQADVKVFYVEEESQCDLKICFVYTPEEAQKTAHWCEVGSPEEADIKIIFVDTPELADINLCVAFEPSEARWLKEEVRKKFNF